MTPRQQELFDYIAGYIAANGRAPMFTEMAAAMGISPGSVATRAQALIRLGYIGRTDRHQVRGLQVLRYPGQAVRRG